jgi:hypothetical protein
MIVNARTATNLSKKCLWARGRQQISAKNVHGRVHDDKSPRKMFVDVRTKTIFGGI